MNGNVTLPIASLLSILFFTFHLTGDIVRGFEPGGFKHISVVLTLLVWPYGTVVLAGRRPGPSSSSSVRSSGRSCPSPT